MMMQIAQLVLFSLALGTTSPAAAVEDTTESSDPQPAAVVGDDKAGDAQPDAAPEDTNTDDFFENVEVEEVVIETVIEAPEAHEASLAEKVSHLHPLVVHMPIAWLLLLLMVEWLLVAKPTFLSETARIGLWALTMVSFVPAIATGLLFSEVVYAGSAVEVMEPILDHRNQVLLSAGLLALAWLVRRRRPEGLATALTLTLAMLAMSIAAHSGGLLIYGEDYFPF